MKKTHGKAISQPVFIKFNDYVICKQNVAAKALLKEGQKVRDPIIKGFSYSLLIITPILLISKLR